MREGKEADDDAIMRSKMAVLDWEAVSEGDGLMLCGIRSQIRLRVIACVCEGAERKRKQNDTDDKHNKNSELCAIRALKCKWKIKSYI